MEQQQQQEQKQKQEEQEQEEQWIDSADSCLTGPLIPADHGGEGPSVLQLLQQHAPFDQHWTPAEEDDDAEEEADGGADEDEEPMPLLVQIPAGSLFYHGCIALFPTDAAGQAQLFDHLGDRHELCFGTAVEATVSAHILLEHIVKTNERASRGALPAGMLPAADIHYGYVYVLRSLQPVILDTAEEYAGDYHSAAADQLRQAHPPNGKLNQPTIPFSRWPAGLADVAARKAAMCAMEGAETAGFSLEYTFPAHEATRAVLQQRFEPVARLTVDVDAWIEAMTANHPQGQCAHPIVSAVHSWPAAAGADNGHAPALPCFAH